MIVVKLLALAKTDIKSAVQADMEYEYGDGHNKFFYPARHEAGHGMRVSKREPMRINRYPADACIECGETSFNATANNTMELQFRSEANRIRYGSRIRCTTSNIIFKAYYDADENLNVYLYVPSCIVDEANWKRLYKKYFIDSPFPYYTLWRCAGCGQAITPEQYERLEERRREYVTQDIIWN